MNNIFLTGEVGIGKSTIISKVIEKIQGTVGGYRTFPVSENGKIVDFDMVSLYDGSYGNLIGTLIRMKNDFEKFSSTFDNEGVDILDKSLKHRDIIVLDEIGILESRAFKFQNKIQETLDSSKLTLGILKKVDSEFLDSIRNREDVFVLDVDINNRDYIEQDILDILKSFGITLKTKYPLRWNENSINWYEQALSHPDNEYPNKIIKEIKKNTKLENLDILDIGAGTGVFTFPLGKYNKVTAVDSSFAACLYIGKKIRKYNIKTIKCLTGYWQDIYYEDKKDIAIAAYCPEAIMENDNLKNLYNIITKQIYIITFKENIHKNFKVDELYKRLNRKQRRFMCSADDIENKLKELNYIYSRKEIDYEFSQYFNKYEDALDFFYHHFSIKTELEKDIVDKFLKENIEEYEDQIKFKNIRRSVMFTINKK